MNWSARFFMDDEIETPDGGPLKTLADARAYILTLPAAERDTPHWGRAAEALLEGAEKGGPFLFNATVAVRTALLGGRNTDRPEPKPKKKLRVGKRLGR